MSLSQALATAISGLRVSQSGISLVAANVANAGTPGYVRKTVNQVATASNGVGIGVNISGIQREIDQYVQRQLRAENAGASYADTRAQYYQQLQNVYGQPGAANALETVYNNFTGALQALSTSPDDASARGAVISSAQLLAQQLNQMSSGIQSLRGDAELDIADSVSQANEAMQQIAALNQKLSVSTQSDATTATLLDQRDNYIDQLSQLMDINVVSTGNNQVSVFTNSGVQLVGTQASTLSFDAQGTMTAGSLWSADPTQRSVGTITLTGPNGGSIDLVQSHAIRSGEIAADLQMRDHDLVQAQNQLDAIAAAMTTALSDKTTAGSTASAGLQTGFSVDVGGLSAGNTDHRQLYRYADQHRAHADLHAGRRSVGAAAVSDSATANPNDHVVGIDFSGGMASVLTQINSALAGTGMTASNPSGTTLQILDDGAGNTVDVNSMSTTATVTSLAGGSGELPFFTDGNTIYSGAIVAGGAQSVGYAGRITVNSALVADPSKLVAYQSGTPSGDATRPNFIYQQLTASALTFPPDSGIGTAGAPFSGSITTYPAPGHQPAGPGG